MNGDSNQSDTARQENGLPPTETVAQNSAREGTESTSDLIDGDRCALDGRVVRFLSPGRIDRVCFGKHRNKRGQSDQAISHGLVIALENKPRRADEADHPAKLCASKLGK